MGVVVAVVRAGVNDDGPNAEEPNRRSTELRLRPPATVAAAVTGGSGSGKDGLYLLLLHKDEAGDNDREVEGDEVCDNSNDDDTKLSLVLVLVLVLDLVPVPVPVFFWLPLSWVVGNKLLSRRKR